MANRFIRLSKSPIGAPILFVSKLNRGLRLYVNYRGLKILNIKNQYFLVLVSKSFGRLGQAKWFTKLDLTDAYYRIRMKKRDEWKTTFQT